MIVGINNLVGIMIFGWNYDEFGWNLTINNLVGIMIMGLCRHDIGLCNIMSFLCKYSLGKKI